MNEVQRNPNKTAEVNPKLTQCLEELNELLERYQYVLVPRLKITNAGIEPTYALIDKVPPKSPKKKATKKRKKVKKGK